MIYSPPTDGIGAPHNCPTTQGVRTQGTIEATQAVRRRPQYLVVRVRIVDVAEM